MDHVEYRLLENVTRLNSCRRRLVMKPGDRLGQANKRGAWAAGWLFAGAVILFLASVFAMTVTVLAVPGDVWCPLADPTGPGIGVAVACPDYPFMVWRSDPDMPWLQGVNRDGTLGETSPPLIDAADGSPITFAAISWDRGRRKLWAGTHAKPYVHVYLVDVETGVSKHVFTLTERTVGLCTGIDFDSRDNTIWVTDDASCWVQHWDVSGIDAEGNGIAVQLPTIYPKDAAGDPLCSISGVLAGNGDILYLARGALGKITRVYKDGTFESEFVTLGGAVADLACDGLSWAPKEFLWFKDPSDDRICWIEVEEGTCEWPGVSRVRLDIRPGACPNRLNIRGGGVLPAAILGTEDFDVNNIDLASLRLRVEGIKYSGPVRLIPNLSAVIFWEMTDAICSHEFDKDRAELRERLSDPLGSGNLDFWGVLEHEPYDVFYSNADGSLNPDGKFVTIEATFDRGLPAGGALNIAEVQATFDDGSIQHATTVASYVALGDNARPSSVVYAVDDDLSTATVMGNTIGVSERLRLTVGFDYYPGPEIRVLPNRTRVEDVATPLTVKEDPCDCTAEGPDGFADLTLKFDKQEVATSLRDFDDGEEVVLTLTGSLSDGTPFDAQDCVIVVKKGGGAQSGSVEGLGDVFSLFQNSPNPFANQTTVTFYLPSSGHTTLQIYDITGRFVATLIEGKLSAGLQTATWTTEGAPSGIYFYKLVADDCSSTRKMILLR